MGAPAINPAILQALRQRLAAGAQPAMGVPAGPGAMAGTGGSDQTQQINEALAGLRSVNPQQVVSMLRQARRLFSSLVDKTGETIPGVSRNLAATLKLLDNAIKEATTAMATQAAAGPPISNSAASAPSSAPISMPGTGLMAR